MNLSNLLKFTIMKSELQQW